MTLGLDVTDELSVSKAGKGGQLWVRGEREGGRGEEDLWHPSLLYPERNNADINKGPPGVGV